MMQALAAETAGRAAEHGAFYESPEFWVAIAFVILMVLFAKPVYRKIAGGLDARADAIRAQIDESTRLRDEAQDLLASYQRKQREAADDAKAIVRHAKEESERLRRRAAEELEAALKRREELARERIAQAEAKAVAEVRAATVDVAVEAARRALAEAVTGPRADALIAQALKDLPNKLH